MIAEKRLGVIAVVIDNPTDVQATVNSLISAFNEIVVGRMGIPYRERKVAVLSLIVDGTESEINSLSGKLGSIPGVTVKVAIAKR